MLSNLFYTLALKLTYLYKKNMPEYLHEYYYYNMPIEQNYADILT